MSKEIEDVIAGRKSDAEYAIKRLSSWVRDYGGAKPQVFIGDVTMILLLAREYMREYVQKEKTPTGDSQ